MLILLWLSNCRKGKTGGLTEAQIDSLLVDFDAQPDRGFSSSDDNSDVDESLTVPTRQIENEQSEDEVSLRSSAMFDLSQQADQFPSLP